ncbi:hypothetical protein EMIT0215P_80087 [Pseudomonas serboccidentalis]
MEDQKIAAFGSAYMDGCRSYRVKRGCDLFALKEISLKSKYIKKTLNLLSFAPVGICKPSGFS